MRYSRVAAWAACVYSTVHAFMPEDVSQLHAFDARQVVEPRALKCTPKSMKLLRNYQGAGFFDNWDFFNYPDPTHGQVNYVDRATAMRKKNPLAYVRNNKVFLKVDDKSWLASGQNRDSVRITSKVPWVKNQMLVIDVTHMPAGCTTWPAFWTVGPDWPNGGEVDIIEGVNRNTQNQYTLHTADGCHTRQPMNGTGTVLETNCYAYANGNTGCGIQDPRKTSFGDAANKRKGGVYATLWTDDGFSFWFFPANKVPWDLRRARPEPAGWGKPVAFFSSQTCDVDRYFANQTIVINTTLNGDWAGSVYPQSGCPGNARDYVADPSHYKDAYWEISSVRVYQ